MARLDLCLFIGEEEESARALSLLESTGLEFKVIKAEAGLRGWMILDFGTAKTPLLLVSSDRAPLSSLVVIGYDEISKFAERHLYSRTYEE